MSLFEKGREKTGGRAKGAKNRLSHAFLTALAEDFELHGIDALRITRTGVAGGAEEKNFHNRTSSLITRLPLAFRVAVSVQLIGLLRALC